MMTKGKNTVEAMVKIYCSGHHDVKRGLCRECASLLDYAKLHLDKCPFGGKKPTCTKCTIHCYDPSIRPKITAIMKYAGPRMISKHPILVLRHGIRSFGTR